MATAQPSGQRRNAWGRDHGSFASVAAMPNGSGNVLPSASVPFTLEAGDCCYLTLSATTGIAFVCVSPGTAGGGDAIWSMDYRSGVITPAALAVAVTSDYAPAGLAETQVIRVSCDADNRILSSLTGGIAGRDLQLVNVGAFALTLLEDDGATGTAANRFLLGGVSRSLCPNQSISLWYDPTSLRWRMRATTTVEEWLAFGGVAIGLAGATQQFIANAGGTRYNFAGVATGNSLIEYLVQRPCLMSDLRSRIPLTNSFGTAATVSLYKNGVITALTVTYGAGAIGTQNDTDQTHRVAFSVGDRYAMGVDSTAPGAATHIDNLSVSVLVS